MPQAPTAKQRDPNQMSEYEKWNKARMDKALKETENFSFNEKLGYVLRQPDYLLNLAAITCLFVTVTAI